MDIWVDNHVLPPARGKWSENSPGASERDTEMFARRRDGLLIGWGSLDREEYLFQGVPQKGDFDLRVSSLAFSPVDGSATRLITGSLWKKIFDKNYWAPSVYGFTASDTHGAMMTGDLEETTGALYVFPLESPEDGVLWKPTASEQPVLVLLHLGWDGEAFVFHHYWNSSVYAVRVSPDGETVTPSVRVGAVTNVYPESYAFSVDPVSGHTWYATASSKARGVWVGGHDRRLQPLPQLPSPDGFEMGIGVSKYEDYELPGIAFKSGPEGDTVVVSYDDWPIPVLEASGNPMKVRTLALIKTLGTRESELEYPQGDRFPTRFQERRLLPRPDGWLMAAVDLRWVELLTLGEAGVTSRRQFVTQADTLACVEPGNCPKVGITGIPFTNMQLRAYGDEVWLGFRDSSMSGASVPDPEANKVFVRGGLYRIMKVEDGCSYPTMYGLADAAGKVDKDN